MVDKRKGILKRGALATRSALVCGLVILASSAWGAAVTHGSLDCRSGTLEISDDQALVYDATWATNGSTAKMYDGSTLLASGASGICDWSPTACGSHTLKLQILNSAGSTLSTLTRAFSVSQHLTYTSKTATSATCTTAGMTAEISCSRCGEVVTAATISEPALGHSTYVSQAAVVATMNTNGYTEEIKCSRCGGVIQAREVIPAGREISYSPGSADMVEVLIDGVTFLSSTNSGTFVWQPKATGTYRITYRAGTATKSETVTVTEVAFAMPEVPNPPTEEDANISIGSTEKSVVAAGGTVSITTSGSGTWEGSVSDEWLSFRGASSKETGNSAIISVAANSNTETRVGFVYISGHVFTVTQAGIAAELAEYSSEFDMNGGEGAIEVIADEGAEWTVRPDCDWISVETFAGSGSGTIKFTVAPYAEVAERTGKIAVGGCEYIVHQVGRLLTIPRKSDQIDFAAQEVAMDVAVYSNTAWQATCDADWVSVVTSVEGNGVGAGEMRLAIAENPSYLWRTATITIGGESYTITQTGNEMELDSYRAEFAKAGGSGVISVFADEATNWTAKSEADWITVTPSSGSGVGSVSYSVTAFDEVADRTGYISVAGRRFEVFQVGRLVKLSETSANVDGGEHTIEIDFTTYKDSAWTVTIEADWVKYDDDGEPWIDDWLRIEEPSECAGVGDGKVVVRVWDNCSYLPRTAKIIIGDETFTITQGMTLEELWFEVWAADDPDGFWIPDYQEDDWYIDVDATDDLPWTVVSCDASWITINPEDMSGAGYGEIHFTFEQNPYFIARTATITIASDPASGMGEKTVLIVQDPACEIDETLEFDADGGAEEFWYSVRREGVYLDIASSNSWLTCSVYDDEDQYDEDGQPYDADWRDIRIEIIAEENRAIEPREGWVTISGAKFHVYQAGLRIGVSCSKSEFDAEGGEGTIDVTFDGEVSWRAVASEKWITMWSESGASDNADGSVSGTTSAVIGYYVEPCGEGESRSATITIGNETIVIHQGVALPSIAGDGAASVTGDTASGFVLKPSDGVSEVMVEIPDGIDASKVTVEVGTAVEKVTANGAAVKVVAGGYDITAYLDIPAAVDGVIDLSQAVVKSEVAAEILDPEAGAEIALDAAEPSIKTARTKPGLTYDFHESVSLEALLNAIESNSVPADTKLGDGEAWEPAISVKGGERGFYTIRVKK